MGQNEYNNWSLFQAIEKIERLNSPTLQSREIELIGKANPKKILDIGCGNGKKLFSYLKENNIDFVGIEKFQRLAENSFYSDDIIIADILEMNFSDFDAELENVDTVTILGGSLNGIFGLHQHQTAWKKIIDLLAIGGKIVFDLLILNGFESEDELGERTIFPGVTPPQFFLSENQLKQIWSDLNIEIVENHDVRIYPALKLRFYLLEKIK